MCMSKNYYDYLIVVFLSDTPLLRGHHSEQTHMKGLAIRFVGCTFFHNLGLNSQPQD